MLLRQGLGKKWLITQKSKQSKVKTMTISDLPVDLLSEILCRVPVRDMRAVRLTCKKWDTLTKNDIFMKMHIREGGESRMVMIMDFNIHLISVVVADVNNPSTECHGRLSLVDSEKQRLKIAKVFHCDGLLLCAVKDSSKVVVWNPYLGQTRWVEPPSRSYPGCRVDGYRYAFGYDSTKKSHKILMILDDFISGGPRQLIYYEIYDLDSGLWKTLDVGTPNGFMYIFDTGVPLGGKTYWLARERDHDGAGGVICFDFTSERFGPLLALPFVDVVNRAVDGVLSSLKGEKLSLMLQLSHPFEFEIWVTDPNNVLWSRFLKVDMGPVMKIHFLSSGFFTDEKKKVAMVFDKAFDTRHTLNVIGEHGLFTEVDVDPLIHVHPGKVVHAYVSSYVPSLVQIKKPVQVSDPDSVDSCKLLKLV